MTRAGNMTGDGVYTYVWDAEGRMTSANNGTTTTYTYDGDGARVKKSSGTLYWRALGGPVLAETDTSGATTNEYVYFGGRMIARRDASGSVFYYFGDHLGSSRSITYASGQLCYYTDFYPFGSERGPYVNTCSQNYKFAGMERDTESGDDHTLFRQYASNLGRWLSPDPLAGDVSNPQSLNRYAYVLNNPTNLIDPLGLCARCHLTDPYDPTGGAGYDPFRWMDVAARAGGRILPGLVSRRGAEGNIFSTGHYGACHE